MGYVAIAIAANLPSWPNFLDIRKDIGIDKIPAKKEINLKELKLKPNKLNITFEAILCKKWLFGWNKKALSGLDDSIKLKNVDTSSDLNGSKRNDNLIIIPIIIADKSQGLYAWLDM